MGKDLEKKYSNALYAKGVNPLTEVDKNLKDDAFSQKKKIWDLAKMEGLVKNDPKLSSIYEKMSTQGREKYGYHYNETIMNILFNEYVMNSPKYLTKYRNAVPVEKRRSRKKDSDSGYDIELKKNIDKVVMDKTNKKNTEMTEDKDPCWKGYKQYGMKTKDGKEVPNCVKEEDEMDETTTSASSGQYSAKAGYDKSHNVYEEDEINEHHLEAKEDKISFIQKHKPQEYTIDKLEAMSDEEVDNKYRSIEKELGLDAYQNESDDNVNTKRNNKINYIMHYFDDLSDYFYEVGDYDDVIAHLEDLDDQQLDRAYKNVKIELSTLDETTTSTSSGQYSTPHAFASTKSKPRHSTSPIYDGGEMVKENYLIDPSRFEMIFESIDGYMNNMNEESEDEMKDSILNYMIKDNPSDRNEIEKWVDTLEPESIKTIYTELGSNLNEDIKGIKTLINKRKENKKAKNEGIEDIMDSQSSMTKDTEQSMGDDMQNLGGGSMIGEDGHCRADEVPVEGVPAGEKGSCRKKTTKVDDKKSKNMEDNKEKTDDKEKLGKDDEGKQKENSNDPNKYNLEYRKKRQQDKEKRLKQHNKQEKKKEDVVEENLNFMENYDKYMKSLDEERKSTSMLNLDKIKKQTADLTNKELMKNLDNTMHDIDMGETHVDQQEEIGDAQKMSADIEKEKMKDHDFESFENVGNSTNKNNKEIPKRNATTDEEEEIALERGLGMSDIVYDNKPDERFEERMKDDMGDDLYDLRQKKLDHRAKAPMYNKDTMPTEDGDDKKQYNKYKKENMGESVVTGKYKNERGQNKFVDFMISECESVDEVNNELVPLNLDGMGNRYTQNVHESSMREDMDVFNFYLNQMTNKVVKKQSTGKVMMNESEEKKNNANSINEEAMNKMKYLWNYEGKSFVDTKETKKYRGF